MRNKIMPIQKSLFEFWEENYSYLSKTWKKHNIKCWLEMYNDFDITNELILCEQAIEHKPHGLQRLLSSQYT